jgi:UDP-N-acetylglucosamine 2-epimerase (non-hydrolysing)
MAPVIKALQADPDFECRVWSTGQHREMLDQVLGFFGIKTDIDLALMKPGQSLNGVFAGAVSGIDAVLTDEKPDMVMVHGDTSTAAAAATAAFHRRVAVSHVEAGLRSGRMDQPWPEEFNRRLIDMVSDRMFAPTETSRDHLLREGVDPARITVTGNTVIDALLEAVERLSADDIGRQALDDEFHYLNPSKPTLLVTGHRRESFGEGFRNICLALRRLGEDGQLDIVYPVHMNPNVQGPVNDLLADVPGVHLIEPVDYRRFVYLMLRSSVILTDSGGVQEEAPSLGKPVLIMRDVTERPEAVAAGAARLVGTDTDYIIASVVEALAATPRLIANPYGDGKASARIVEELKKCR